MEVGEVTTDWLRRHLGWPVSESDTVHVSALTPSVGLLGRVYRVECAGRTFVFKCPPTSDNVWRDLFVKTGLHNREVQAYKFLGAHCRPSQSVAPECYWSVSNYDGSGALALEDLTRQNEDLTGQNLVMARFSSGLSYEQAAAAVRTLAVLHSLLATTDTDALSPPYPWMYSASSEGLIDAIAAGLSLLPEIVEERLPAHFPREKLLRALNVDVRKVVAESHVGSKFTSFCHGDAWSNNILFREGAPPFGKPVALLIDWQFAMWGNPLSDVALLVLSSVPPHSRRLWTDDLLRQYHSALLQRCDISYGFEECLADFVRALNFAGLVAVATLDAYTGGLTAPELESFAPRLQGIIEDVPTLFD